LNAATAGAGAASQAAYTSGNLYGSSAGNRANAIESPRNPGFDARNGFGIRRVAALLGLCTSLHRPKQWG
jgi:hypothetical protein